ncbi:MAG: TonB-dependent receptor [Pseudomonadota bacterium]
MQKIEKLKGLGRAVAASVCLAAFSFGSQPATAQPAASSPSSQALSIPSGPLGDSLVAISNVFGVNVLASEAVVEGKTAPVVSGTMGADAALSQALAGSGLTARRSTNGSFVVSQNTVSTAESQDSQTGSEDQPSKPRTLEEITIYGENIRRGILDTNTSINVQTESDIVRSNDKRITDVFNRAANVNVNGTGLQAFTFSIRGINSSGIGGAGSAALASLMVDGAAFTTQQLARGFNSLFDVEQVEMLRGPQSTAQARNSLAGGVVVSTNDPEFQQNTQAIAAVGNYGTYEIGVANTGPITDELAYRITVQRLNTDGFIENPTLDTDVYNFNDTDTFRGKLLYRSQRVPLEVLLSHTHVQADARNDVNVWFPETRRFTNGNVYGTGGMDTEQDVKTLNIRYQLSDSIALEAQTAYNNFVSEDRNSNYATSLPDLDQTWLATADQDEFNQTLRLEYEGSRVRGAVGLFYSDETNRVLRDGVAFPNFAGGLDLDALINSPTTTETTAVFGEFDIEVSDKLLLTLGGRYEQIDLNAIGNLSANLILPPPVPYTVVVPNVLGGITDGSTDFSEFLPKVGLTYSLSSRQRLGFTYTEGYRQGGVTTNNATLEIDEFDPEFVKNYELSYKASLGAGFELNANLFYLDWTDQQVNDAPPGSVILTTLNSGESEVSGMELEMSWRNDQWDAYASLGLVETEFKRFTSGFNDFSGNEFPNAPGMTAAAGAFYTRGDWTLGAEGNYRDGFFTRADNEFKADSLMLFDLSADYRWGDFTVRAFVDNVLDDFELITETFLVEGIPQAAFSQPRTYGVQLMYGF